MTQADAAELVLKDLRRPLHRNEITDEIIRRDLPVWGSTNGPSKTPSESIGRALTQEIANRGDSSRFEYVHGKGSGVFQLRTGRSRSSSDYLARPAAFRASDAEAAATPVDLKDEDLIRRITATGAEPQQFAREAVLKAVRQAETHQLEERQRQGYERHPIQPDEFTEMDSSAWDEL
jgi:hypothetical protein